MARCRISNPKKLKRIAALLGREIFAADYRGGNRSEGGGHYFTVHCVDGTHWLVSSTLKRFEPAPEIMRCVHRAVS